ncbi:cytochrome P450 [Roridomyces roridus]|uniref:Cytochrome P450 n=1 Tax=Roridomyces roridus TaxID=1738132 RepID=A0AAD7BMQ9_9AGAR|nr:cytochrome P450 [Roridomyces roridus]
MSTSEFVFGGLLLAAALWHARNIRRKRSRLPLPPGPKKLPLVGNLFDVPAKYQWETYARWSKEYDSDVIHLDLAGKSLLCFAQDSFPMLFDLMGWDFNIAFMRYGDEWRIHRRIFNQAFNLKASKKYEPHELLASRKLLKRLLDTPDEFLGLFRQMAGELIISFTYGIDVQPTNDPYVTLAHRAIHTLVTAAVPGLYLVDSFPILKHIPTWFPGAGFKRQAREWRKLSRGMMELPFMETKRQMDAGISPSSFTSDSLNALKDVDAGDPAFYQEHHVQATAATSFVGGADTTVSALGTFVLAMLANPEAQKKAQAEIDSVTHGDALPTFEDRDSLPYVSAIVKEVLRWKNVTPFAVPHRLSVEDEYRGYRIPAGSVVVGNAWALLHDETVYPDPHTFKPERFLLNGQLDPSARDPEAAFGFGRRRCPGRHMADSSMWITIASILAAFDITKAVDEEGKIIEPSYEYASGVVNTPLPFKSSIKPRSIRAAALIKTEEQ